MSADELLLVPLKRIRPSPLNPRKHFDEAKLQELASSIAVKGVLEPVLLRRHPASGAQVGYELVAGERRVRAAALAGLDVVPAIVRRLDDRSVLEIMVVENEQREDVAPLERADGYARLVEQFGVAVEDLASKIGKAPRTIQELLHLRRLPEKARRALEGGDLSLSVAQLVCRIPNEKARQDCALLLARGRARWHGERGTMPYTYADAKALIQRDYCTQLAGAPFDRKALDLVPAAGSCDACPKRVGNLQKSDPEGYRGVRADVCADPACYRQKVEAWQSKVAAAAKAEGTQVLEGKAAHKLFLGPHVRSDAPYLDLADTCWEALRNGASKTYGQVLKHQVDDDVVLAFDERGEMHRLVPKEKARPLLKQAGAKAPTRVDPDEAKRRAAERLKSAVNAACLDAIVKKAAAAYGAMLLPGRTLVSDTNRLADYLRIIIPLFAGELWHDTLTKVLKRRGKASGHFEHKSQSVEDLVGELDGPGLFGLLVEMAAAKSLLSPWHGDESKVCKTFAIDRAAIEKTLRAEKKGRKDGKVSPNRKG